MLFFPAGTTTPPRKSALCPYEYETPTRPSGSSKPSSLVWGKVDHSLPTASSGNAHGARAGQPPGDRRSTQSGSRSRAGRTALPVSAAGGEVQLLAYRHRAGQIQPGG